MSGRLLSDITRSLPAKPVDVTVEGRRVSLTCGSARFSLPTLAVEDYPTLPTLPEETGVISADLFAEAIGQVAVAAGRDDTLPMLTGIRVEISGDTVVLAATDRFRLAVRELTWSTSSPTWRPPCWCRPRRWRRRPRPAPRDPRCTSPSAPDRRSARRACWVFTQRR